MNEQAISARLDLLLSESLDSARQRQQQTLFDAMGDARKPFVLFGAGNLGKKVAAVLLKMGMVPEAFIDNNASLWGTSILGIEVLSPAQLAARESRELPAIIVTIWCGEATDTMVERLAPLRALGFDRIAPFGYLAWRFPEEFLPYYSLDLPEKVLKQAGQIRQAFELLADDASRQLFVDHVEWRLTFDYDLLPPASTTEMYFDDQFANRNDNEVVYDIGAFDGDSIHGFIRSGRQYREIHSFEPSARNFLKLEATLASLADKHSGLHAHALAVGDSTGEILIEDASGAACRVGMGSETVQMTTLDELSKKIAPATFIKIDIEGFEPQCLAGGRQLISELHPVLAVCVYHLQDHLWSILLQLHEYHEGYQFSLCQHLAGGWDLVLYAVPADRVLPH
ncbi:hypothetical protein AUC61_13355 [Pseudomonas sp. S25]|uniref:Methyltransferase FkbM domain-containing protein n=1 Tax=Pseudomonas maioricensis TaxID=1766623 RepID=A0ABS9ZJA5_9PSED|nr:FkbM family methyltransferase [Pseudomonas sp. S25]MCI8210522.1 hypothetical protein [Pseudomonas sp. S25]